MIETARLRLRAWRDADKRPFREACNTPAVMAHLGGVMTADAHDALVDRLIAHQAAQGHCFWAVERRADAVLLGFCGLKIGDIGPIAGDIEIGWRLREDAWGQGYAREAAEASLAWGWAQREAARIVAITVPANAASWGLMERLGMARRPDLDFGHPAFPADHPLHRHISYAVQRPTPTPDA